MRAHWLNLTAASLLTFMNMGVGCPGGGGANDATWSKTVGGPFRDRANCVRSTPDGGFIFAGSSENSADREQPWVVKLSAGGEVEFQRLFGSAYSASAAYGSSSDRWRDFRQDVAGTPDGRTLLAHGVATQPGWIEIAQFGLTGVLERRVRSLFPAPNDLQHATMRLDTIRICSLSGDRIGLISTWSSDTQDSNGNEQFLYLSAITATGEAQFHIIRGETEAEQVLVGNPAAYRIEDFVAAGVHPVDSGFVAVANVKAEVIVPQDVLSNQRGHWLFHVGSGGEIFAQTIDNRDDREGIFPKQILPLVDGSGSFSGQFAVGGNQGGEDGNGDLAIYSATFDRLAHESYSDLFAISISRLLQQPGDPLTISGVTDYYAGPSSSLPVSIWLGIVNADAELTAYGQTDVPFGAGNADVDRLVLHDVHPIDHDFSGSIDGYLATASSRDNFFIDIPLDFENLAIYIPWRPAPIDGDIRRVVSVGSLADVATQPGFAVISRTSNDRSMLYRFTGNGTLLWQLDVTRSNSDLSTGSFQQIIPVDLSGDGVADDGYAACGYAPDPHSTRGDADALVMLLDTAGNPVWQRLIGTELRDEATAIVQTSRGLLVVGNALDSGGGSEGQPNEGFGFLAEFSPGGDILRSCKMSTDYPRMPDDNARPMLGIQALAALPAEESVCVVGGHLGGGAWLSILRLDDAITVERSARFTLSAPVVALRVVGDGAAALIGERMMILDVSLEASGVSAFWDSNGLADPSASGQDRCFDLAVNDRNQMFVLGRNELHGVNALPGTPAWSRRIEFGNTRPAARQGLFSIDLAANRGTIAGGSTDAVTGRLDAWLLKLNSTGQVSSSCPQGYFQSAEPLSVSDPLTREFVVVHCTPEPIVPGGVLALRDSTLAVGETLDLLVTRQCFGSGTDFDGDGVADDADLCPETPADLLSLVDPETGCSDFDIDRDGDGVPDFDDDCPDNPAKTDPGICGCSREDVDSDRDGVLDCNDQCPNDPDKTESGGCGCGNDELDSDRDAAPDCLDACPFDPFKINPGGCGCGQPETPDCALCPNGDDDGDDVCNDQDRCPGQNDALDTDGDGTPNCLDGCPNDPTKTAPGICGCGVPETDTDGDGQPDCIDPPGGGNAQLTIIARNKGLIAGAIVNVTMPPCGQGEVYCAGVTSDESTPSYTCTGLTIGQTVCVYAVCCNGQFSGQRNITITQALATIIIDLTP